MKIKTKCPKCRTINISNPLRGCRTCSGSLIPKGNHGKKEKVDLKRLSLLLPPEMVEKIDILAKKNQVNRSAVIRFILESYLRGLRC